MVAPAQINLEDEDNPFDWADFFAFCDQTEIPADFLSESQLNRWNNRPDPFEGCVK